MPKVFGKWPLFYLGASLLIIFCIQAKSTENRQEQQASKENKGLAKLNSEDKVQLTELLRLKKMFGNLVWPGFGEAEIPLIQYNEQHEFLVAHPDPPAPWTVVDNDTFQDSLYYRRQVEEPQAFAVPVGDLWAGSLDTLSHMNKSLKKQLQEKIPPEKLTPAMIKMMEITPAQHVVSLLHEAFHAFQAIQDPDRFLRANKVYATKKHYPFEDEVFKNTWNKEGSLLAAILREKEELERIELIQSFLEMRTKRRVDASLSPELIAFERELEWLEGLAKYVEMRFSELGSSQQGEVESKAYRIVRNRLQYDFSWRISKLGELHGDLRFYLSGAIQAMILDKISPGWKHKIIIKKNTCLEDILQAAIIKKPR
ncbi:MAG: hypothetical protein ACETWK_02940 [Candidatus Aminicenantaceae bacterium]